ncbi:MAG TPA: tetratricopeptide repeat protein [Pyrinomonadaceae bacterium]|jgi:tetratricopeptide (TPR) repeat protein
MNDKFKYDVFLSHSSKDKDIVRALGERLESDGVKVWFDEWAILPGDMIGLKIEQGLVESRVLVLAMSRNAFASDWVTLERHTAIFRDPTNIGRRFIPLLLEDCEINDFLKQFSYVDWRTKDEKQYQRLLKAVLSQTNPDIPNDRRENQKKSVPVLLSNLPTVRDFVGRGDDLDALREFYENGKRVFLLHGVPGVGKTALAFEFAHKIKGEYATHIFVDMQGLNHPVLAAEAAMYEIVKQFEPNTPANITPNELQGLYTQFLSKHKTLLVLDNADDEQQIEPLNVVDDSCLLVTSRRRFALSGGMLCEVGKMLPSDAKKLLVSICERIGKKAGGLAKRCGRLPLALRAVASALEKNRLISVESYIAKLQDRKERLRLADPTRKNLTVEAAFDLSYEMLDADLQLRWRQLAVFPADFAADGAAAIWETDDATDTLNDLDGYSLLEVNEETGRFTLHDLARDYTTEKLTEEDFATLRLLHVRHYAEFLRFVQIERKYDYQNALNLLDLEWNNIMVGQKWSAELAEIDKRTALLCFDYLGYVNEFIIMRLHPRDYIERQIVGLAIAQKLENRFGESLCLGNLGNAYLLLGDYRKVIEYHEQSLLIQREIGGRQGESASLGNLATAYSSLGDYRKAIEYNKQALEIDREFGNRLGEAQVLGNLGNAYCRLGDYGKAIDYQQQSLSLLQKIGNRKGQGVALGSLGIAYGRLGDYRKAIDYNEQYLQISQEIGDQQGQGLALGNLGSNYGRLGDYRKAIKYSEQSLLIQREIGDRQGEGISLGNLGSAYDSLGEMEKACGLWRESLAILESIESPNANIFRQLLAENCQNGE